MRKIKKTDRLVFDLEMLQIDYNEQKKEALRREIAEKYCVPLKNVQVNFKPITVKDDGTKISLTNDIINDIQDPKFQQELFKEYIRIKGIENVDFDALLEIDKKVNAFIDFDAYSKYRPYKIKYLKWDNYLSYGKGNFFDFTKLNGLVLLTGQPENTSGKTTLAIDLLRFALFGKAEKSPTLDSVFNTFLEKETEVMVEACIEIDSVDYIIRRTITRPSLSKRTAKSKVKQKVEFFKLVDGQYEEIENCEGESGTQTNNIIRESVGNIEDFDLVISATAYTLGDLLRMGQTDKSKLFSRWFGLLTIEEKEKIAKELWKKENNQLISSRYNKGTLQGEIKDMKTVIESDKKAIAETNDKLKVSNDNIDKLNKQKTEILSKRKEIKEELLNIDVASLDNKKKQYTEELGNKRAIMSSKKERYNQIKDVVFNSEEYQNKVKEERLIEIENAELKTKIVNIKADNERIKKLSENKTCPTCGHEIDVVEQEGFINKNNEEINKLISKGVENKKRLDAIRVEIENMETKRSVENELNRLKPEMIALKVQIDNIKLNIGIIDTQKKEVEDNSENIKFNNDLKNQILINEQNIKEENNIKERLIRDIASYKTEIENYEKEIEKTNKVIEKIVEEEKIIRAWTIYQELIGKNGILKIALKRALPIVNNEISRLLSGLCDFDVSLTIDENNKICLELIRDGKHMDLGVSASGWEGCISSIALRCALANLGSLPKANFCCFDEITSGVSSENIENIMKLFGRVLNNYDFIIHICHDTSFADYHNMIITVTKENNISKFEIR